MAKAAVSKKPAPPKSAARTKPAALKKPKAAAGGDSVENAPAAEAGEPEQKISHALAQSLSEQFTEAVRQTLADDRELAYHVAVAALLQTHRGPARISAIANPNSARRPSRTFAQALRYVQELPVDELEQLIAEIVADTVDLRLESCIRDGISQSDSHALVAALDQKILQAEALTAFEINEYFAKAPAKAAIAALVDIDGSNSCSSKKKADIAALAAIKAKLAGWLPPELRGPGYTGPGSKPAVAEAAE